jgi:[acyl-carrier-protein] S-malonyltransferase
LANAQRQGQGRVLFVGLDEEAARAVCAEAGAHVANLNCPGQIVISGDLEAVSHACELAKVRGAKRALPLPVAGAYHSPLMASAQPKLRDALAQTALGKPSVPVVSNVTARPHDEPGSISQRLIEQVTSPVRWEDSMRHLLALGFTRFIELGPGTALTGFMKRIDKSAQILNVGDLASLESATQQLSSQL